MAWRYDGPHSRVGFIVKHFGITMVHGHFRDVEVNMDFNEEDIAKSSVDVTIQSASFTTGFERRDTHTHGDDYLGTAEFPTITFKSKRIEPRGENQYAMIGDFTLRGITREISLDTTYAGEAIDAHEVRIKGVAARGTIKKGDYGIRGNPLEANVGEDIQLVIDVELRAPNKTPDGVGVVDQ